jgi:effector-binding domain-containing protein
MRGTSNAVVGIAILLIVLVGVGLWLPAKVRVTRSADIAAPPATVFGVVDNFRVFEKWSPWLEKDPDVKTEISGARSGVGARYTWSGNQKVGSGSEEITAAVPDREVDTKLSFSGFSRPSRAAFRIEPNGQGSKITWVLDVDLGPSPLAHYLSLFMDGWMGPDFEHGLAKLKSFAEALPKADFSGAGIEEQEIGSIPYLYVSGTASSEAGDIVQALAAAYAKVGNYMHHADLQQAGPPIAVTRRWEPAEGIYEFEAGIPVAPEDLIVPPGEVKLGHTYEGLVLKVRHRGPYTGLHAVYEQLAAYKAAYGLNDNGAVWERYLNDPAVTAPGDLLTVIYVPVK